jgi:hypothetical protein
MLFIIIIYFPSLSFVNFHLYIIYNHGFIIPYIHVFFLGQPRTIYAYSFSSLHHRFQVILARSYLYFLYHFNTYTRFPGNLYYNNTHSFLGQLYIAVYTLRFGLVNTPWIGMLQVKEAVLGYWTIDLNGCRHQYQNRPLI